MVGLLHAMAFMVLLLVGWVIWNNKLLYIKVAYDLLQSLNVALERVNNNVFNKTMQN